MFISVVDIMLAKTEEKSIIELYSNDFFCYSCKNKIDFTPPPLEETEASNENLKKAIFCEKCKRIFYCSIDCMKKLKNEHTPICLKICEYHSQVNEVVDKINKMKNRNEFEEDE